MGNAEYMGPVPTTPDNMHLMILVSLAAAASAAPQIVPYEHVEIEAEPYVHEEIEALPYIHEEPELSALSLGIINRNKPAVAPVAVAPQQFAAPVAPQQFAAPVAVAPQQFAAPVAGVWAGSCINNLGQGVPCRAEAQAAQVQAPQQQFVPQAQAFAQQQFVQPRQVAQVALPWNGACINHLGAAVPCSQ